MGQNIQTNMFYVCIVSSEASSPAFYNKKALQLMYNAKFIHPSHIFNSLSLSVTSKLHSSGCFLQVQKASIQVQTEKKSN